MWWDPSQRAKGRVLGSSGSLQGEEPGRGGEQSQHVSAPGEGERVESEALEIANKVNDNPGAGGTQRTAAGERRLGARGQGRGCWRGVDGMGPAAGPQRVPFLPPLELPVLVFGAVWSKEGAGGAPWPRCLSWRTRGVLEGAGTPQHPGAGCWGRFGHGATRLGWHAWIVQLAGCLESTKSERIKKKKKKRRVTDERGYCENTGRYPDQGDLFLVSRGTVTRSKATKT